MPGGDHRLSLNIVGTPETWRQTEPSPVFRRMEIGERPVCPQFLPGRAVTAGEPHQVPSAIAFRRAISASLGSGLGKLPVLTAPAGS
jgi:hypothetical protein